MAKYLNLFTDYGFKKFFCDEANQELLLDFLNALLVKYHRIKSVAITTEQPIVNINHKNSPLYNVDCISSKGEAFLVLLQKNQQKYFLKRDIY